MVMFGGMHPGRGGKIMSNGRGVRKPVQARAKATVDNLCEAAVQVIESGGFPAFNTNAVAAQAGVSIQTLYAYFPDKYDILREIFSREQAAYANLLMPTLEKIGTQEDWRAAVAKGLRATASALVADPGFIAVRNAMMSVPGMAVLTSDADDRLAASLATSLRERRPDMSERAVVNAARLMITTIGAGLERVTSGGKVDRSMLNELIAVTEGALERFLEPEPALASTTGRV